MQFLACNFLNCSLIDLRTSMIYESCGTYHSCERRGKTKMIGSCLKKSEEIAWIISTPHCATAHASYPYSSKGRVKWNSQFKEGFWVIYALSKLHSQKILPPKLAPLQIVHFACGKKEGVRTAALCAYLSTFFLSLFLCLWLCSRKEIKSHFRVFQISIDTIFAMVKSKFKPSPWPCIFYTSKYPKRWTVLLYMRVACTKEQRVGFCGSKLIVVF